MIYCGDCGKQISERATACPGCGAPVWDQATAPPPLRVPRVMGWVLTLIGFPMLFLAMAMPTIAGKLFLGLFALLMLVPGLLSLLDRIRTNPLVKCRTCGQLSEGYNAKGSAAVEVILWLIMVAPGLLYSLWRHSSPRYICTRCHRDTVTIVR